MRLTIAIAAAIVVALPGLAAAQCMDAHDRQAMSCVEGMQWNVETGQCEAISTS